MKNISKWLEESKCNIISHTHTHTHARTHTHRHTHTQWQANFNKLPTCFPLPNLRLNFWTNYLQNNTWILRENNLLSLSQSGFCAGGSSVNQLLSITHDVYHPFDEGFEARAIFLHISRAFEEVWRKGLIYKLCQHGCSGDILSFLTDFPTSRKKRVIKAGVHQRSILRLLLLLLYINDWT